MTDREILDHGYWLYSFPLAGSDMWGYALLRQLKNGGWTTENTRTIYKTSQSARKAGVEQLIFILKQNG
jgi:hypothetical protein